MGLFISKGFHEEKSYGPLHPLQDCSIVSTPFQNATENHSVIENTTARQAWRIKFLRKACKQSSQKFYLEFREESNLTSSVQRIPIVQQRANQIPRHLLNVSNDKSSFKDKPMINMHHCNDKYNFCICIVPKAGSTAWLHILQIIDSNKNFTFDSIFNKPRVRSRGLSKLRAKFQKAQKKNRTILMSRDPYTRLYSAFVDKFYIPNKSEAYTREMFAVAKGIPASKLERCTGYNITFQNFLTSVVYNAIFMPSLKYLDRHWAPMTVLCEPCFVNQFAIIKQETFAEDTEDTLRLLNIDSKDYDFITYALNNKSSDIGIVQQVKNFENSRVKVHRIQEGNCFTPVKLASRIWQSLQIQGHIADKAKFPLYKLDIKAGSFQALNLLHYIEEARGKYPMTTVLKQNQRKKYLIEAYKQIDSWTIKMIRNIYRKDFAYYNYDSQPSGT